MFFYLKSYQYVNDMRAGKYYKFKILCVLISLNIKCKHKRTTVTKKVFYSTWRCELIHLKKYK